MHFAGIAKVWRHIYEALSLCVYERRVNSETIRWATAERAAAAGEIEILLPYQYCRRAIIELAHEIVIFMPELFVNACRDNHDATNQSEARHTKENAISDKAALEILPIICSIKWGRKHHDVSVNIAQNLLKYNESKVNAIKSALRLSSASKSPHPPSKRFSRCIALKIRNRSDNAVGEVKFQQAAKSDEITSNGYMIKWIHTIGRAIYRRFIARAVSVLLPLNGNRRRVDSYSNRNTSVNDASAIIEARNRDRTMH